MAFDDQLGKRVRDVLAEIPDVSERRMFGGLALLVGSHMACGSVGSDLLLQLGEAGADAALELPHVRPMDFTRRPMRTNGLHRRRRDRRRPPTQTMARAIGRIRQRAASSARKTARITPQGSLALRCLRAARDAAGEFSARDTEWAGSPKALYRRGIALSLHPRNPQELTD